MNDVLTFRLRSFIYCIDQVLSPISLLQRLLQMSKFNLIQILCTIILLTHFPIGQATMLRSRSPQSSSGSATQIRKDASSSTIHPQSTSQEQIVMTNTCQDRMKVHIRFFDDKMRYTVSDDEVRLNQQVKVDTNKRVTVVMLAAETRGFDIREDLFSSRCASSERGYAKYSDGLCYKFYYSTDVNVSCASWSNPGVLRQRRSIIDATTVEIGLSGPRYLS